MTLTAETISTPVEPNSDVLGAPLFRLTVAQYHAMARAGILTEDDPVELLGGYLVRKMTKHKPHSIATRRVRRALEALAPDTWYVESQEPITTADSEPEPDVFVARVEVADDPSRHPEPHEVALVCEVADLSLALDRGPKKALYARAGIPVYWILNLIDRQVEVYTEPTAPAAEPDYGQQAIYRANATLPVVLDGVEVGRLKVQDLLP